METEFGWGSTAQAALSLHQHTDRYDFHLSKSTSSRHGHVLGLAWGENRLAAGATTELTGRGVFIPASATGGALAGVEPYGREIQTAEPVRCAIGAGEMSAACCHTRQGSKRDRLFVVLPQSLKDRSDDAVVREELQHAVDDG